MFGELRRVEVRKDHLKPLLSSSREQVECQAVRVESEIPEQAKMVLGVC